ncbi:transcriptional regulator, LuxR family [Rhizobium sp. RU20A]|uniref:helix-turn-helix transcriptional regulator n=1 Tax=Rhizobium sp. RU20A TaxID=1907412 RepID=UPI0009569466|nr:helix-turn-helix transcriptional regulator [Rhizobium sp. RU20A]SIQ53182.1 transcriptional regulator, LuxR family [Rhizobium sp. RU20A]
MAGLLKNHRRYELERDLDKALNRVDFFRIFRSMALRYAFDHFGIVHLTNDGDASLLSGRLILHDLPSGMAEEYDKRHRFSESSVYESLITSAIPSVWTPADIELASGRNLLRQLGFDLLVCIPVAAPTSGSRYGVLYLGDQEELARGPFMELCYETVCAFDYFYRVALASKAGMGLTPRETEILRWISYGKTASEIALIVSVSEHTVNSHTATILKKLNVVNRTQMVAKAIRERIIQ